MKKMIALVLTVVLLLGVFPAVAEEAESKYDKLTVTVTTPFSGNFFSDVLGSNISDQDVRKLIHGYNLVYWDSAAGCYQFNPNLVGATSLSADGTSYILAIVEGLTYSDGTPINARDYAFSLLLQGSPELKEAAGSRGDVSRIWGGRDYQDGKTDALKGVRILSNYQIALTVDPDFVPYFYQLKALDISPMPISVIAPGCEIKDDGDGAYIDGDFSAEVLEETLLDPLSGYMSYPTVTSGPYTLTNYDEKSVTLELNEKYEGDENGIIPTIPKVIIQVGDTDSVIGDLVNGKTDLVVRCARKEQIEPGRQLIGNGDFSTKSYARTGLSFINFCAEKGATSDLAVRQALSMCMDKEKLVKEYIGDYGLAVDGFFGIGQWMYQMANGSQVPEEGQEEEWADLTLDGIRKYEFDPAAAGRLLEENGWEMDRDGVLSKAIDGVDVHLHLKLIYPEGNGAGPLLDQVFTPYLNEIGIELETEAMPMPELLKKYYRQEEPDCDMILLGTNFGDVYDPSGEYDDNGTSYLTGITDPELLTLAINMRSTEPGNATEYCRRWLRYQERLAEDAAELPLYTDPYFDFHISALQRYEPGQTGNWAVAIPEAVLSDYIIEEEPEDENIGPEGDEMEDLDLEELE